MLEISKLYTFVLDDRRQQEVEPEDVVGAPNPPPPITMEELLNT
jgi:hypothetical protein